MRPGEGQSYRIPEEWPAGAKPVHKKIAYDDLYRAKRIDYEYAAGDDAWTSPFAPELDPEIPEDPRRGTPSPHVAFAKRILWQTYQYDWLGNNVRTDDDAHGFYDRSLGDIENGTAEEGPYQLLSADNNASGPSADTENRNGQLVATYDAAGNLETLFVQRNAGAAPGADDADRDQCLGGGSCSQAYRYAWDEVGRLSRARRWDVPTTDYATVPDDDTTTAAHLRYAYGAGDNRVLKTAVDAAGEERHAAYVFASLELRGAEFDTDDVPGDYVADEATEVGYLFANGVRLARLVNEPLDSSGLTQGLRVFFELGDHLGSHSVALDKATSELVERSTYQAYGGAESSHRPDRWGSFRGDYRFTGKEEDVEVGLTYFGKRYLNTHLQRWVSADPLTIHGLGGDPNCYAYVSGLALRAIDPLGLQEEDLGPAPAAGWSHPPAPVPEVDPCEGGACVLRPGVEPNPADACTPEGCGDPHVSDFGGSSESQWETYPLEEEELDVLKVYQSKLADNVGLTVNLYLPPALATPVAEAATEAITPSEPLTGPEFNLKVLWGVGETLLPMGWGARGSSGAGAADDIARSGAAVEANAAGGAGRLTSIGNGQWRSSAGLVYGQGSVHGNRVRHVLAHAAPDASKPAHSVYNVARNQVLGVIDEAWGARGSYTVHPSSGNWNYRVDMGRVIGTEGQTAINISVRPGTSEIITAFPVP